MIKKILLISISCLAFIVSLSYAATNEKQEVAVIKAALQARINTCNVALENKDLKTLSSIFLDNATWIQSDASTFNGTAEIEAFTKTYCDSYEKYTPHAIIIDKLIVISDTEAQTYSHVVYDIVIKGKKETRNNPFADYWIKGSDGVWRVAYEINADGVTKDNTPEVTKIVTQLENDWTVASDKGDAKRMAEILAPDWINIRAMTGAIESRDEYIKRNVEQSKSITEPSIFEINNVRVMGDVAVVTGQFTGETSLNGKLIHDKQRFQDVFNKRNGVWVIVNSDNTSIK